MWVCVRSLFSVVVMVPYCLAYQIAEERELVASHTLCCGCLCYVLFLMVLSIGVQSVVVAFPCHLDLLYPT